jgi:hypothetical protein
MSVARHLARLQVRIETIAENHSLPGQTGLSLQDTLVALTFSGFSDDIVIIVASALVVSAAVARSGVMEAALQRVSPYITSLQLQVVVLVGKRPDRQSPASRPVQAPH